MAVQPAQLDPLPIPQQDQNTAPNPPVPPPAQPQPGMGWVKGSGAAAYVASNILTGWMAGTHAKQQRKLDEAKQDIVGAKTAYDVTAQNYQNLVDQGLDPNKPEDAQKLQAAKTAVNAAWSNYLDRGQKYSVPGDEGGKKKKKDIKGGLHDAFMGKDPQFFVDSSLQILRKSGPPALSYGTSQDEKNRQQLQSQQLKMNEQNLKQNDQSLAKQADVDELQKQYQAAVKSGDEQAKHSAREALAGYGVNVQRIESEAEAKVADEIAETKLKGIKTLEEPGKTTSDLTVAQRAALGIQLGPLDAYMNEVGQGKKFKNAIDANKAYLHDQAAASAIAGRSAQAQQWNEMEHAESVVLQHDLQDPRKAQEYGLPGPLKPGEKVPDWLIKKSVMGRLKPTPEERADAKVNVDKSISHAIDNSLKMGMDAKSAQWAKDNLIDYDEQTKSYSLKPMLPDKQSHTILGMQYRGDTMGGLSPDEFNKKRQAVIGMIASYIKKTNPEASADRIMSALNSEDAGAYFLDHPESGTPPTPGADRNISQPPAKPETMEQLGEEPVKGKYQVQSPDGKVQEMELTSDEAEYITNAHPDVIVRYTPLKNMPHGR